MPDNAIIPAIRISASGLDAESRRMEVIANNVANAQTTRGKNGKVFRRQEVVFAAKLAREMERRGAADGLGGVEIKKIVEDGRPPKRVYRPGHPEADSEGFVSLPNINVVEEMVDMMGAARSYEANLAAIKMSRGMADQAIEMMKK